MRKKYYLLLCLTVFLLLFNPKELKAQNDPYSLISAYVFDETKVDDAIDLLSELQQKTLEGEPGCLIFDVLIGEDDATAVFIYESYESETAYAAHIKKKYYLDIVSNKLKPLTKQLKTIKVFQLNFEGEMSDAEY